MMAKKKKKSPKRKKVIRKKAKRKMARKKAKSPAPVPLRVVRYPSSRAKLTTGHSGARKVLPKTEKLSISETSLFKARIRVIGIGGGGGSIVSEIGKSLKKASFVVADTDIRALKKNRGVKQLCFGQEMTHGLGAGMNPDLARAAAEKEKEKIAKIFDNQDIVILVACLGGGVGSGAAPYFAEIAKNSGKVTLGIFTLPFRFEGKKKSKIAHRSLKLLRGCLNASIAIPNERIFKVIGNNTPITEAFSIVNKNLIDSLESLIDIIYNPGLINIDFADLRTILKGRGNLVFLNTFQASGKNRAEEVIKNIFHNPLYSNNLVAEKILFNISGGNNLSMVEVEKISKAISALNPKAKIIFGISKDPRSKNKIRTTVLVAGSGSSEKLVGPEKKEPTFAKATADKKATALPSEALKERRREGKGKEKIPMEKPSRTLDKIGAKEEVKKIKNASGKKKSLKESIKSRWRSHRGPLMPTKSSILGKVGIKSGQKIQILEKPQTESVKAMFRRNALEIKKDQEIEENKKLSQESEWEIPAFLRRMKK